MEENKNLKTLKDIDLEWIYNIEEVNKNDFSDIIRTEIKYEARKWFEQLEYALKNNGKKMPEIFVPYEHVSDWRGHVFSITNFIQHFFNLDDKKNKELYDDKKH